MMVGLVRQLKLHGLVGDKAPADGRVGLILAFFAELFDGIQHCVIPEYDKENVIFHKGETFYMELDFDNDRLWCRHEGYWSILQTDLSLGYDETQAVVKYMVEKYINREVGTPHPRSSAYFYRVEKYLKRGVGTPENVLSNDNLKLERHLKQLHT